MRFVMVFHERIISFSSNWYKFYFLIFKKITQNDAVFNSYLQKYENRFLQIGLQDSNYWYKFDAT